MKKLLQEITKVFAKNGFNDLVGAVDEKKLLYLYAFYHYYYGDDDCLYELTDHCKYSKEYDNFAQGFFEEENYDEKIIDIIVPYYVSIENGEVFSMSSVKYMISQTQSMIGQMKNKMYTLRGNANLLKEFWDPSSGDKLLIKVVTNYSPEFDEKNDFIEEILNISPLFENIKFEIVFGDDIEEEISQLTSDKKCVEYGELTLDKAGNYLSYGDENSIITNITAFSLKDNFIRFGKAGLFAMNLRFYIPNKKVDEGLEKSIKNNGENFWYYNNGIIIVCDDFKMESNKIKLNNYSIVNGGQTTRMIGTIPFEHDFAISCKIIRNKFKNNQEMNTKFVSEIAEASNTQKPINSTDIIANRYEQRYLKQRLSENNIFMQIKRGDSAVANLKENYPEVWQRTKNDELGQLIFSTICQKPGTARNSKDKIFSDKNKYQAVFGNPSEYNMDFIKDLLFIKAYYKKWSAKVSKDQNSSDEKRGIVRNGYLFFAASIVLMSKFAFSKKLTDELKTIGVNSEKGNYVISQRLYNHRIFNDSFIALENRMYDLFELVCDKYVLREFLRLKEIKPDLVYSNFTKVDKNYTTYIAPSIYDDFAASIHSRVASVINPIFYNPNEYEIRETDSLVDQAFLGFDHRPIEEETIDILAEELKERLTDFRTSEYKARNIKAYEVFTNVEMKNLITLKPRTKFELMEFNCFKSHPRTKVRLYGDGIVEIIKEIYGDRNI